MTPFEIIKNQLYENMVEGEMHGCIRDCGRTAGGYYASGSLSQSDIIELENVAMSLAKNSVEASNKWNQAVAYGQEQPLTWEEHHSSGQDEAFGWDDEITHTQDYKVVKKGWLEVEQILEPEQWDQKAQIIEYLSCLFEPNERVSYCTDAWQREGSEKWLPSNGNSDRCSSKLINEIRKCSDIEDVIGSINPEVGAWVRINPVDGLGSSDSDIVNHRYALIESDNMSIDEQAAVLKKMELPIAVIVHSGSKSLHAIVKVHADSYEEYQERVDFLYSVCKQNGFNLDKQNRNPSRYSRLPGVVRNGKKQFIVAKNIGHENWESWKEWIEELNDELPDIETLDVDQNEEPELAPVLIDGILREGHKLLLSGPSKAGKSWCLMQLSSAFSTGGSWMGFDVRKCKSLYVNLELDKRSAKHRFWKISQEKSVFFKNIDTWNLRGAATTMDKLAPKLIRRAKKAGYKAIIIDPIYKVLTGDENSAEQMAHFTNQFDKIAVELDCAVIYCHHHSKGTQGQKNSKDRSSGSGVFARDPDAIMDLIELQIDEGKRNALINNFEVDAMSKALDKAEPGWRFDCPQDTSLVNQNLMDWALENKYECVIDARAEGRETASMMSGWRIESVLREFKPMKPTNVFFKYPIHIDDEFDLLKDAKAEGEEAPWKKDSKPKKTQEEKQQERFDNISEAFNACDIDGAPVTLDDISAVVGVSSKTVKNHLKGHPNLECNSGIVQQKLG